MTRLGKGVYGTVDEVFVDGKSVAAKTIDNDNFSPIETHIMGLEIVGIIGLRDVQKNGNKWVIQMEKGVIDLAGYLKKRGGNISSTEKRIVIHSIGKVLSNLHEAGFSHSDVKPGNILVMNDGSTRIIDFSLSSRFDQINPKFCSAPYFSSFEKIRAIPGWEKHIKTADSWAFGITALLIYLEIDEWKTHKDFHEFIDGYDKAKSVGEYLVEYITRHNVKLTPEDINLIHQIAKYNLNKDPGKRLWMNLFAGYKGTGSPIKPREDVRYHSRIEVKKIVSATQSLYMKGKNMGLNDTVLNEMVTIYQGSIHRFEDKYNKTYSSRGFDWILAFGSACMYILSHVYQSSLRMGTKAFAKFVNTPTCVFDDIVLDITRTMKGAMIIR